MTSFKSIRRDLFRKIAKIFGENVAIQGFGFAINKGQFTVNLIGYNEEFILPEDWSRELRDVAQRIQTLCSAAHKLQIAIRTRSTSSMFSGITDNYVMRSQIMSS